jgi:hypothetical protein
MDRVRTLQVEFASSQITRFLSTVILLLVIAHLGYLFMRYRLGYEQLMGFGPLVDFWVENNLPNFYSSMTMLFAALLLYVISCSERGSGGQYTLHWLGMAVVFAFLAADEMVQIHELTVRPVRALLGTSGVFYFAWVIPYGVAVIVLGIIYLRFFLKLPARTRTLMMISAVIYVGSAVGLEMFSSFEYTQMMNAAGHQQVPERTLMLDIYNLVEEVMEMIGVLIFIRALTDELARRQVAIGFFSAQPHSGSAVPAMNQ